MYLLKVSDQLKRWNHRWALCGRCARRASEKGRKVLHCSLLVFGLQIGSGQDI